MFKYQLHYLPYKSPYFTDDIVDVINKKINDTETMREYFLIWSFKTPESNKIMISNELININDHLREYKKAFEFFYEEDDDDDKQPLNYIELIKTIYLVDNIDKDLLYIKISNKIVCRYFDKNENRTIKRYLKETGEYAVFFKLLLKSIILKNIFPDDYNNELKYICKKYYDTVVINGLSFNYWGVYIA